MHANQGVAESTSAGSHVTNNNNQDDEEELKSAANGEPAVGYAATSYAASGSGAGENAMNNFEDFEDVKPDLHELDS